MGPSSCPMKLTSGAKPSYTSHFWIKQIPKSQMYVGIWIKKNWYSQLSLCCRTSEERNLACMSWVGCTLSSLLRLFVWGFSWIHHCIYCAGVPWWADHSIPAKPLNQLFEEPLMIHNKKWGRGSDWTKHHLSKNNFEKILLKFRLLS